MALGDVGDFVGHDAGKFGFVFGGQYEAGMHTDIAAGPGESVDGGIIHHKKAERVAGGVAVGHQPVAELLDVVVDVGVGDQGCLGANAAHELLAELGFLRRRNQRAARVAKVRQVIAGDFTVGGRGAQGEEKRQSA